MALIGRSAMRADTDASAPLRDEVRKRGKGGGGGGRIHPLEGIKKKTVPSLPRCSEVFKTVWLGVQSPQQLHLNNKDSANLGYPLACLRTKAASMGSH